MLQLFMRCYETESITLFLFLQMIKVVNYKHTILFREQRVTGVMVFILTGLSVKLAPILKVIYLD